jgi:hypothetical protein
LILVNTEGLALILAGQASNEVMSTLLSALEPGSDAVLDGWLFGALALAEPGSVIGSPETPPTSATETPAPEGDPRG